MQDKPVISLEKYYQIAARYPQTDEMYSALEDVTPDINGHGGWVEEAAKAAGFHSGDFHQNAGFFRGPNLWRMGKTRSLQSKASFDQIGNAVTITIEHPNVKGYVDPMSDDPKLFAYLSIVKKPDGETKIQAFRVPKSWGLSLKTPPLEACAMLKPLVEMSRPNPAPELESGQSPR